MNEMVSPLALELHRAYLARQTSYANASRALRVSDRLKITARKNKEERMERMRVARERQALLICKAVRAFVSGVALALDPVASRRKVKIHDIQIVVANSYSVTLDAILSNRRTYAHNIPRQVAMYLSKAITLRSLPEIGRCFHRDHTTVLHGIRKITAMMEADEVFRAKVEELRAAVTGRVGG